MTPSTSSLASDGNAEFTVCYSTICLISIDNFGTGGIVGIVVGVITAVLCVIVPTVIGAIYHCHKKVYK